MARLSQTVQGIAILDPRWTPDNLADTGAGSTDSSYTEATPRPGASTTPDTRGQGRIEVSNAQETSGRFVAVGAGDPRIDGSRWAFRKDSEAATSLRGWNPPNHPTHWTDLHWSTTVVRTLMSVSTIPTSQEVIAATENAAGVQFTRYDTTLQAWITEVAVGTTAPIGDRFALGVIPDSERIVVWYAESPSRYSDDKGATWATYGDKIGILEGVSAAHHLTVAVSEDGSEMVAVASELNGSNIAQHASSSLGTTWSGNLIPAAHDVNRASVFTVPGGGFGVVYLNASDVPCFRLLGGAWDPWSSMAEVLVDASPITTAQDLCGWGDPGGVLWVLVTYDVTAHVGSYPRTRVRLYRSDDSGTTWNRTAWDPHIWRGDVAPVSLHATPTLGGVCVLHSWTTSYGHASAGKSIGSWFLGGYSTAETSEDGGRLSRFAFGEETTAATVPAGIANGGMSWYPWELPNGTGGFWTQAGTVSGALSGGALVLNTTSQDGYYTRTWSATTDSLSNIGIQCLAHVGVSSGGSLSAGSPGIAVVLSDGTTEIKLRIYLAPAGFAVVDGVAGTTKATITVDTTDGILVWFSVHTGGVRVYYRTPGIGSVWTLAADDLIAANTTSPDAASSISWGVHTSGTQYSRWWGLHCNYTAGDGGTVQRAQVVAGEGLIHGRSFGGRPTPIPALGSTTRSSYASASGGPVRIGERYDVTITHDHPLRAAFPTVDPSPARGWRSSGVATDPHVIALGDLGSHTRPDGSWGIALALVGSNLSKVYLERWTGSTWATRGTWESYTGFADVHYSMVGGTGGDLIRPESTESYTGNTGDRWLQASELVGGYAILDPAGTPKVRKIAASSSGPWVAAGSGVVPHLRLEDCDGTEGTSGRVDLVWPAAVLVHYNDDEYTQDRWRVRWTAAENPTAEGYYQIGALFFGAIRPMGRRWSRGWSRELRPNVETVIDPAGTIRRRELGPAARVWGQSWNDAIDITGLRGTTPTPDHLSPGASSSLTVGHNDLWWQIDALILDSKGGERPVVALASLPATDATITDRTLWLYGSLAGSSQANTILGDEGADEVVRVESIEIQELV